MPGRVNLPGASELFRRTEPGRTETARDQTTTTRQQASDQPGSADPNPSGRVRHEEKITVYVTAEELLALEQARLELRARHRVAVDRGRIVRAAVALALADLGARGEDCDLVARLREE